MQAPLAQVDLCMLSTANIQTIFEKSKKKQLFYLQSKIYADLFAFVNGCQLLCHYLYNIKHTRL